MPAGMSPAAVLKWMGEHDWRALPDCEASGVRPGMQPKTKQQLKKRKQQQAGSLQSSYDMSSDGGNGKSDYEGMLHSDVLQYMATEHSALTEELVELARLQAIELGDAAGALRTVDAAIALTPAPKVRELQRRLWMEGIAAFYSGKWDRGAAHFEIEMAVNPDDVEVPVWRWLCDAHNPARGVRAARERLLECGHDVRDPFPQIWRMYKGANERGSSSVNDKNKGVQASIAEVMRAVERDGSEDAVMWGNFYVALYLEALGRDTEARPHFLAAVESGSHNNIAKLARAHWQRVLRREAATTWARLSAAIDHQREGGGDIHGTRRRR